MRDWPEFDITVHHLHDGVRIECSSILKNNIVKSGETMSLQAFSAQDENYLKGRTALRFISDHLKAIE